MSKQSFLSSRFCNTAVRAIHQQGGVMVAKPGVQSSAAKSAAPQQKPDVQSTAAKPAPRERVRSRSPTSHAAPCRGCAQCGQTNEKHSTECRHLDVTRAMQKDVGQEVLVVNLKVAFVKLMPMLTLETMSRTWRARGTFR